nr:uncharacterized protein LOC129255716 [Lytechinus pictus]
MSETKIITERPDGKEGIGELWRRWKRRIFTNNPANLAGAGLDARRTEALQQEVEKYGGTSFGIDQGVSVHEHWEGNAPRVGLETESIHVKVRRGKTVSHGSEDLRITSRQLETKPRSHSNLEYAVPLPSVFRNEHSNAVDLHEKTLYSANDGVKETDPRTCSSESLGHIYDTSPDKPNLYLGDANIFVKGSTCETSATSSLSSSPCIDVEESLKDRAGLAFSSPTSSSPNIQPTGACVLGRDVETEKPEMNFKHQITQLRNRRGQGTKMDAKAASSAEDDEWADIPSMDVVSMASSSTDETASGSSHGKATSKSSLEDSASVNVQEEEELHPKSSEKEWSNDQKGVYEMQLENLQEQLVDIMIENQTLENQTLGIKRNYQLSMGRKTKTLQGWGWAVMQLENLQKQLIDFTVQNQTLAQKLQKYENSDIIPLLKKLEEERDANESLTKRCETLEDHMKRKRPMHQISVDSESRESVQRPRSASFSSPPDDVDGPPPTRWERFQNHFFDKFFTLMADFTEEGEESDTDAPTEGDELTVKKLKENLKRFQAGYEPGLLFCKAMSALVSWKSTSNTFLAFVIYMYVVWRGWSATLLIGLLLWYLTTTYFISRGWTIQFSFLPYHLVEVTQDERPPLSMSDRFQLVLHVSRRVQNILGSLADQMEKVHNFLYWTNPDLTKSLYTNLVIAFVASLFISGSMLLTLIGLFLGVKIFLINPVLKKYPRLKAKYSFEEKIFREAPTAAQLEQRRAIEETQQFLVPDIEGITVRFNGEETQDSEPASKRFKAFAETFNVPESEQPLSDDVDGPPPTRWERFQNHFLDKFFTLMADFTEEGEESDTDAPTEGDELTVKKLKENLKRFQAGYEPGLLFCKAMSALVSWKSTSNTFLAFVIYMYVVWRGWSATLLIGLLLWYLTTTYFISRGWTIQFSFLPYHLVEVTQDERPPLSMSDRFQLVLHVSRRVQNILGSLADQMEKVHNFLYWTNPDLTKGLYTNLVIAFVASLFISGSMLLTLIGLFLGVKVFLINPVLKKYPRLKAKYSFEEKIFREAPTAAQLEQRRAIEETQQFLVPDIEGITVRFNGEETQDSEPASKRFKAFAETFNVPESEQPLSGWKEGKRCTLITKNTVTGAFKNGRLYLTKSFLCFEKSSLSKDGNMLIPLKEILRIEKAKPFNFMPGSGMSIEIHMASADKPVLFGGMLRRNLIYDQLMEVWQAAQRAIQHRSSSSNMEATPSTSQGDVRSRAGSHRQASSSHSEAGESDSESAC